MWTSHTADPRFHIIIHQQPERARLCSFKEENETIDRRPVDPPPIVEVSCDDVHFAASSTFFLRASLVHPTTEYGQSPTVLTPNGTSATAGEVVQTLERLQLLSGKDASLCIFAKLSIRMPGIFRLRFTLYAVSYAGVSELGYTQSDPFEVFSPKQFRGMRESTAFTRHLAAQGVKVKLRTDTTAGRATAARRKVGAARPTGLVWHSSYDQDKGKEVPAGMTTSQSQSREPTPQPPMRRFQDDGSVSIPRTHLSAFSLNARRESQSTVASLRTTMANTPLTPITTPNTALLSARTDSPFTLGGLRLGPGDDGIAILPPPLLPRFFDSDNNYNNIVLPPLHTQVQGSRLGASALSYPHTNTNYNNHGHHPSRDA